MLVIAIIDKLIQKKFLSTQGLSDWEKQQLQVAARKGTAVRVRNGVYVSADALADTMVDISLIVRSRKVTVPQYPEFKLVYQSGQFLSIGVTRQIIQGYDITLFDIERCVCDAVKYRKRWEWT